MSASQTIFCYVLYKSVVDTAQYDNSEQIYESSSSSVNNENNLDFMTLSTREMY